MDNLFSKISDSIFTTIEDIEIRFQNVISNSSFVLKILSFLFFAILKLLAGIILLVIVIGGGVLFLVLFIVINQVINKFFVTSIAFLISILLSIIFIIDICKYSKRGKSENINQDLIEILQLVKYILLILTTLHCILKSLDVELN